MSTEQITLRLDSVIAEALRSYCNSAGLIINRFIQDSILDSLQDKADLEDIPALLKEPKRPFSEVLKELNLDG